MEYRMTRIILGVAISLSIFGVMLSNMLPTGLDLPSPMTRPDYVPESAVQRITARIWFDCEPAESQQANHFKVTIYDGDTMSVRMRRNFFDNPEIVENGAFVASGPPITPDDLRRLFQFYDGETIYLRNGETLSPLRELSYR
jgi:hypothetical protein